MRICLLTQSDPFYLAENIEYLFKRFPDQSQFIAAIIFDVSPFGKKESFIRKAFKTANIFGIEFFVEYAFRYLRSFVRNNSVESVLRNNNIPIVRLNQSINHPASVDLIKSYNPDLLVSIAGNQIFRQSIIDLAPKGCLNLHTALLPKYRGLMPSFWVLKNCEKETGVSVFFVDKGIDSGPILVQERIPIPENMTQEELIRKSKKIGMDAIIKAVNLIQSGNYALIQNKEEDKTYYSFPTRKDVKEFRKEGKKFY